MRKRDVKSNRTKYKRDVYKIGDVVWGHLENGRSFRYKLVKKYEHFFLWEKTVGEHKWKECFSKNENPLLKYENEGNKNDG